MTTSSSSQALPNVIAQVVQPFIHATPSLYDHLHTYVYHLSQSRNTMYGSSVPEHPGDLDAHPALQTVVWMRRDIIEQYMELRKNVILPTFELDDHTSFAHEVTAFKAFLKKHQFTSVSELVAMGFEHLAVNFAKRVYQAPIPYRDDECVPYYPIVNGHLNDMSVQFVGDCHDRDGDRVQYIDHPTIGCDGNPASDNEAVMQCAHFWDISRRLDGRPDVSIGVWFQMWPLAVSFVYAVQLERVKQNHRQYMQQSRAQKLHKTIRMAEVELQKHTDKVNRLRKRLSDLVK